MEERTLRALPFQVNLWYRSLKQGKRSSATHERRTQKCLERGSITGDILNTQAALINHIFSKYMKQYIHK